MTKPDRGAEQKAAKGRRKFRLESGIHGIATIEGKFYFHPIINHPWGESHKEDFNVRHNDLLDACELSDRFLEESVAHVEFAQ